MREWTFAAISELLRAFLDAGYVTQTVEQFMENPSERVLVLRHDVDRYPQNSLKMAQMEKGLALKATYYFRAVRKVFKEDLIRMIADLGHEIGYHYEELAHAHGDHAKAIRLFEKRLQRLRQFYPVKTICMHGSPLSLWDNKTLWDTYQHRDFGIIGDTSFDIDYDDVFYVSDNGRGWNKTSASIRDKVSSRFSILIKNTSHFISLIRKGEIPDRVILNAHPDTFFPFGVLWGLNFIQIEAKNVIKRLIVATGLIR